MNRLRKFRVYDTELREWINNLGMKKNNVLTNGTEKRFHVMDFTGMCDANGQEIYEHDFLIMGKPSLRLGLFTNQNGEAIRYEVRFEGCEYILYRPDVNMKWGPLGRITELCYECQVYGNVYDKTPVENKPCSHYFVEMEHTAGMIANVCQHCGKVDG